MPGVVQAVLEDETSWWPVGCPGVLGSAWFLHVYEVLAGTQRLRRASSMCPRHLAFPLKCFKESKSNQKHAPWNQQRLRLNHRGAKSFVQILLVGFSYVFHGFQCFPIQCFIWQSVSQGFLSFICGLLQGLLPSQNLENEDSEPCDEPREKEAPSG